jgi:predicted Holliday junction resolvase-like endonuclease
MEDSLLILLLVVLLFLAVAIGAAIILAYRYVSLKGRIGGLARREFEHWRAAELAAVRRESLEVARQEMLVELERWKSRHEQTIRQDAIQRSQAVTLGRITEHFIPYLPDFSYNPKDARFIGSPIDFVVFDGLTDGDVRKVVFVEIKTGASNLSTRERRIRDAVRAGNVEWRELRPAFE